MKYEDSLEYQFELRRCAYATIMAELYTCQRPLTVDETATLGICQYREGLFEQAEQTLLEAARQGHIEALIELQGVRLALLKFDLAREALEQLLNTTQGFHHSLALRWAGIAESVVGNVSYGVGLLTQGYRECQATGNERGIKIIAGMLGGALIYRGELEQAIFYLKRSLSLFQPGVEPGLYIDTCHKLFVAYAYSDRVAEAEAALKLMQQKEAEVKPFYRIQIRLCETMLYRVRNDRWAFARSLLKLTPLLVDKEQRHVYALVWLGPPLLDALSRMGQHRLALATIRRMLPSPTVRPLTLRVVEGVILLRRGGHKQAVNYLEQTLELAHEGGQRVEAARCQLYLADALYKSGLPEASIVHLNGALGKLQHLSSNFVIRDDLESVKSVMLYGASKPETAQLVAAVRSQTPTLGQRRALQFQTFGHLELHGQAEGQKWVLDDQNVLLILSYLLLRPDRTVDQIAQDTLTEKYLESPESACTYVRQAIYLLRQAFGKAQIVMTQQARAGAGRYRVGDDLVLGLDIEAAHQALANGEMERLFEIYQWPFAARTHSDFTRAINDDIEGAVYQYLRTMFKNAASFKELQQLERWVRLLIAVAPDNEDVVQLSEDIDAAIEAVREQDIDLAVPFNF